MGLRIRKTSQHIKLLLTLVFCVVVFWAGILRVYQINQPSYWIDEGYSITLAQAIQHTGFPILDSGSLEWRSVLYHYTLAGVLNIFGTSEVSTRAMSVVSGVGLIFLLSAMAYVWFNRTSAFFTAILCSFSYFQIAWSRQARMYIFFECWFWLSIFLFDRLLYSKKRKLLYASLCVLSTVATLLSHELGVLLVVPYVLSGIFYVYRAHINRIPFRLVLLYVLSVIGFILISILSLRYILHLPSPVQYAKHYGWFVVTNYIDLLLLSILGWWHVRKTTGHQRNLNFILLGTYLSIFAFLSFAFPLLEYRYLLMAGPILFFFAAGGLRVCTSIPYVGWILALLIVALSPSLRLIPQVDWPLESDSVQSEFTYKTFTPQPEFKLAYAYIQTHPRPQLITPYPALSRLYLDQDDTFSLYFDLTGGLHDSTTIQDPYTAVPTATLATLKQQITQQHGYILLDQFSSYHIDPRLRQYILAHTTQVLTDRHGSWSEFTLYGY